MTLIIVLFVAAALLLAAEVVVPGGILGLAGGLALLAGVIVSFVQLGFDGGLIALVVALGFVGIVLYLEFVFLPKSRLAKTFSMTATVAGTSQPAVAERSVIGRRATALTPLVPSGIVECDGKRFEAFSRSGHVRAGELLDIVDLDNFRLIVTKPSTHETK